MSAAATVSDSTQFKYSNIVKVWLITGLVMIFVQVVVGGITRLTGSGLSITKWEIVTGTIPPLNADDWNHEFELYKATPQYQKINEGMTLSEFKFIFFWEYIHRLWARLMGFVFAIPFFIFLGLKMLDKALVRRLIIVVLLAGLVASFGWIMVKSGLYDRPWVNAYKLTMHLSLALILYSYLLWTTFKVLLPNPIVFNNSVLKKRGLVFVSLIALQIVLGGIMSGMKAGLSYPTWPDMNGSYLPSILLDASQWTVENFVNYDSSPFMPAIIQFLHRNLAYLLVIIGLWLFRDGLKAEKSELMKNTLYMLVTMLIIQVLLGIFTLVNCKGTIPVGLGVLHQAGALLLLTIVLFFNYQSTQKSY